MQKITISWIVLFLLFNVSVYADNLFESSPRTLIAVSRPNIWSYIQNTATLTAVEKLEGSLFFQNHFNMKELSTKSIQVGAHARFLNIGIAFSSFGYSNYNENIIGLAFARKFSKRWMLGIQFDYYSVYFSKTEGYKGKIFPQIGILSQPAENFYIGFQVFNPTHERIKTTYFYKEIPSVFSLGGSYYFSNKLITGIQLDKEIKSNLQISVEINYQFLEYLSVKLGCIKNEILIPDMGLGVTLSNLRIDTDFKFHSTLGIISGIALTYKMK